MIGIISQRSAPRAIVASVVIVISDNGATSAKFRISRMSTPSLSFNTKLDGIERWSILYRLRFVSVLLALPMFAFGPKRTFQSFGSMHTFGRIN
jgi:hypothetical protein